MRRHHSHAKPEEQNDDSQQRREARIGSIDAGDLEFNVNVVFTLCMIFPGVLRAAKDITQI